MIDKVRKKLLEYGKEIYDGYPTENKHEYVLITEDVVLFIKDKVSEIGVSFSASLIPETVANMILILNEIPKVKFDIMDSFIFLGKDEILIGEQAHNFKEQLMCSDILKEYDKQAMYQNILHNAKCFAC